MERLRKIAVIGAEGHKRRTSELVVDCYPWDKVTTIANIRDYDIVLLTLLSLETPGAVDWPAFYKRVNPYTVTEILRPGGLIIVIGDPRFHVKTDLSEKEGSGKPFLRWTGMRFLWDNEPGDTVIFDDDWDHHPYRDLVKNLRGWRYSLKGCELDGDVVEKLFHLDRLHKGGSDITLKKDYFCRNRYGGALAFSIHMAVTRPIRTRRTDAVETVLEFGPMIFLPPLDLSEDETIMVILHDLCGVEATLPEPEWLADFAAPGQKVVDREMGEIRRQMIAFVHKLRSKEKERQDIRKCLKLLYDRGDSLAHAVRDVLTSLGAVVEDPEEPGKEDGWLVMQLGSESLEAVFEVKGTRNDQFDERGIKQLHEWIHRGVQLRQKKYKGIFIGNSAAEIEPKERSAPFSDNFRKALELHGMVAVTTSDLYQVHLLNSAGKLDREIFWRQLFATDGIFEIKSFRQTLASKESTKATTT